MDEMEPTSGRLLLFEPNQVSPTVLQLRRVASNDVPGCVYSLAVVDGMLAAAINSCVRLLYSNLLFVLIFYPPRFLSIE